MNQHGEFKGWEPVFDKYYVKKVLGSGSFGEVVQAECRYTG
jgi:hypothetical protein